MKTNLGIISEWYPRGIGYMARLLRDTLKNNYNIFIFGRGRISDEPEWRDKNLTKNKKFNIENIKKWVLKNQIKVIFIPHIYYLGVRNITWEYEKTKVKVVTIPMYEEISALNKEILRSSHTVLAPVKCTSQLLKEIGIFHTKHIQWAIDTKIFTPKKQKIHKNIIFLHSAGYGGYAFRKNSLACLLAFSKANKIKKNIKLIFKTQLPLKKYPTAVQKLVKKNKNIKVIEKDLNTKELVKLYRSCDTAILPSKWEGIGLPYLEALSCGLPVIGVNAPPMNEWIKNNYNGYNCYLDHWAKIPVPEGMIRAAWVSHQDLARQIIRFSNKKFIDKLSKNATNSVKNRLPKFKKEINKFIKELLAK